MTAPTRRAFNGNLLASLTTFGLLETLWSRDLFADAVRPTIGKWVSDLQTLCQDVKTQKIKDIEDHYLIKPTIDRGFKPGECSTISDHKDNVHWFVAESETGFIFNIHVIGYNPQNPKSGARIYVDPEGEKTSGGLIVARKMT